MFLVPDHRLPIRDMNVGEQDALRTEGLQPGNQQVRAIEPDLAKDFGAVATAQHGQDVVASDFVIEFLEKHALFFANLGPQQSFEQVLRPEILDRFVAVALRRDRAD